MSVFRDIRSHASFGSCFVLRAGHLVRLPAYCGTSERGVEGRRVREEGGREGKREKERQHLSCVPLSLSVLLPPKPDCFERGGQGKRLRWMAHCSLIPEEPFGVQGIQTHCLAGSSFLGIQWVTDFPRPGNRGGVLAAMGQGPRQSLSA